MLIHLLDIVEQDPVIDAATDNLSDTASNYLKAVERAPRMKTKVSLARRLNELELAFSALRRSLIHAKLRPGVLW